jgi:hypothetical protein
MKSSVLDGSGTCPALNDLCNANAMPQVFIGRFGADGVRGTRPRLSGRISGEYNSPDQSPDWERHPPRCKVRGRHCYEQRGYKSRFSRKPPAPDVYHRRERFA